MIVIDTNIIISALIRDSETRRILIESAETFAFPEISMEEIIKHSNYIMKKGGYTKDALNITMNKILGYINLVPIKIITPKLNESAKIMKDIDINDAVFIAAALALNKCPIWSDDKDFDRQKTIKIIKTSDMVKRFHK